MRSALVVAWAFSCAAAHAADVVKIGFAAPLTGAQSNYGTDMQKGVQLELCGATARANHWGNANLLPGIKVNVNAMVRLTQLEQEGYKMIYE